MNRLGYFCVAGAIFALALPQDSMAEDSAGTFSGSVALTSDYLFRGISQTNNDPALQGGVTWTSTAGFYAGAWASTVDFVPGDKADAEVDLTAGYAGSAGDFTYDVGVILYAYPGARSGTKYDYWEGAIKLGRTFGDVGWSVAAYYSPENFGGTDEAGYFTTGFKVPFGEGFTFDANIGRAEISDRFGEDYTDWNVGITYALPFADANVRYYDTDNATCAKLCDTRVVFTLSRSF